MESLFLAIIYFLLVVHMLHSISVTTELIDTVSAIVFIHTSSLLFLIGPAIYMYSLSLISPSFKLSKRHFIHLIPFIISSILIIPYSVLPYEFKVNLMHSIKSGSTDIRDMSLMGIKLGPIYVLRPLTTFFYLILAHWHFFKNINLLKGRYGLFKFNLIKLWFKLFLTLLFIANISNVIIQSLLYFHFDRMSFILLPSLSFLAIAILGFQLFLNPYILYGFNQVKFNSTDSFLAKMYLLDYDKKFDQDVINDLIDKIETYEVSHPYLTPGFTIEQMAYDLEVSLKKLRYYFKNVSHYSFSVWKNRKRIEYAIHLLNDGFLKKFTMEELSLKCGFRSRSNFNEAIKKFSN